MSGRSKPPSLLACISCRKAHLKCDGVKPICSRCSTRRGECMWMESRRGYKDYFKASNQSNTTSPQDSSFYSPRQQRVPNASIFDHSFTAAQLHTYNDVFDTPIINQSILNIQLPIPEQISSPDNSASTTSIDGEPRQCQLQSSLQTKETTDLIDVYYKFFHPANPFIIPRKLYKSNPCILPEPLRAVMRFVAAHFYPNTNIQSLQIAATSVLFDGKHEDVFKVQALLLFAIVTFARHEQEQGGSALEQAIQLAQRLGMSRQSFYLAQGRNSPVLQESFRRTWWTLYMVNGLVKAIGSEKPFFLHSVRCDVSLPTDCTSYNNLITTTSFRSLNDLLNLPLSQDTHFYSSFAYAILATHIMGNIFLLGPDTFDITDPQVETISSSISSFLLSLPASKRDVTSSTTNSTTDEVLLTAHMIIHWAAILIHRPRSSLVFIHNHYATTCTTRPAPGMPALAYASHTAKTLHAANALISLAGIPRPLMYSTPIMICGITVAATVHLPAYAAADGEEGRGAMRERLKVGISALGVMGEVWPRANVARGQVAAFAREVLLPKRSEASGVGSDGRDRAIVDQPPSSTAGIVTMPQLEYTVGESGGWNVDPWMESLIHLDREGEGKENPTSVVEMSC